MNEKIEIAKKLIDFIYESPSSFHTVKNIKTKLLETKFTELRLRDKWYIEKGGRYFVAINDSAIISFIVGNGDFVNTGFRIIAAHTDAPTFRIKPFPEIISDGYLTLNTEVYGGPILSTWMDRPLSIAGRVSLRSHDILYPRIELANIRKPILIIPSLAIHMNRKVNEGIELNKQKDMLPLMGLTDGDFVKEDYIKKLIAEELNIPEEDIIDFDLFLYEYEKGSIIGVDNEFISCSRLDDLAMVNAGIEALVNTKVGESTSMMVCFDNEEVGSKTKQGAGSPMLKNVIERIIFLLGGDKEDLHRAIYSSFIISADMTHAIHPNYNEKHDPINKPKINKGPVIKVNANQRYTTDSDSDAVYEQICKKAGIPVQKFVNRSDARGGSTIGPILSSQLDIRSLDIGNPILAMHSTRELGGVLDHYYVIKSFEAFYKL